MRGSKLRRKPPTELSYAATDPQIIGKNVVVVGLLRQNIEKVRNRTKVGFIGNSSLMQAATNRTFAAVTHSLIFRRRLKDKIRQL